MPVDPDEFLKVQNHIQCQSSCVVDGPQDWNSTEGACVQRSALRRGSPDTS